jgi:hypothetical protein
MEEKKYQLGEKLIQDILNYLATKPYGETFQLIANIQREASHQPEEKKEEPPIKKKENK